MTSSESLKLAARIERWPIAGAFTISRGAKTEAVTVVAEVSQGGHTGRGECVPYPRYGETPEATLAALQAMQEPLSRGMDRMALQAAMPAGAQDQARRRRRRPANRRRPPSRPGIRTDRRRQRGLEPGQSGAKPRRLRRGRGDAGRAAAAGGSGRGVGANPAPG